MFFLISKSKIKIWLTIVLQSWTCWRTARQITHTGHWNRFSRQFKRLPFAQTALDRQTSKLSYDIFMDLAPNHSMILHDLTTKRCCLLGVCGFMRTSDIEPIDLDEPVSTTFSDKIILKAMSPKEKHLGLRIQKEITIRQNDDHLFCPVAAIQSYLSRHTHRQRQLSHPAFLMSPLIICCGIYEIAIDRSTHNGFSTT